jgi:hypothetical protein
VVELPNYFKEDIKVRKEFNKKGGEKMRLLIRYA